MVVMVVMVGMVGMAVTPGMAVTLVMEVAAGPLKRTMQRAPIEGRNPIIDIEVLA